MAIIETLRPGTAGQGQQPGGPGPQPGLPTPATDAAAAQAAQPDGSIAMAGRPMPDPAAFRTEAGEGRLAGLVAFALAVERQEDSSPDAVARLTREAEAALTDHAFRTLHNNVERLQRDAVREQLGHLPRPPGLLRMIGANLVALALAAAAGGWLALHPQTLAGLAGLLAG